MPVAQKHRAISRQEKMSFSTPVGLSWDSPPPAPESVRAGGRTYADVTTKISRIDRLPNLLSKKLKKEKALSQVFFKQEKTIGQFSASQIRASQPTSRL